VKIQTCFGILNVSTNVSLLFLSKINSIFIKVFIRIFELNLELFRYRYNLPPNNGI
jgi:hypothetical protein